MKRQLIVTAAIIDETERVLLTQRAQKKRYGTLWEFPGGKVKEGETCQQAIVREIAEELGLDIVESCLAPLCFVHEQEGTQEYLILLYVLRVWQGIPKAQEAQPLAWVKKSAFAQYPMPAVNQHLVAMLRDIL